MSGRLLPDCATIANSQRQSRALLVPVQIKLPEPASVVTPAAVAMVLTPFHGYRLEISSSVSAGWVAELMRCLA